MRFTSGGRQISAPILVAAVAPGLFAADSSGHGPAAAQLIRVHADGSQEPPQSISGPIERAGPSDTLYVVLYGTGIRHFAKPPSATLGGQPVEVVYAGPQDSFPGLDQVNIRLPAAQPGPDTLAFTLTVDGVDSNTVTLSFR